MRSGDEERPVNINLLPWRENKRQENKKQFSMALVISVVIGISVIGFIHFYFDQQMTQQSSRNTYLRGELGALDRKIKEIKKLKVKRKELLERMEVVHRLQGDRPVIVLIFDNLVNHVPEGVYFSELIKDGQMLTIRGVAENNGGISSLMRRLDKSVWFKDPNLIAVKALDVGEGSRFSLNVTQEMPEESAHEH